MTVQYKVLCNIHNIHFNPFKWKAGLGLKATLIAHWSYDHLQPKKVVSENYSRLDFWLIPQVFVTLVFEKNTALH